MAKATVIGILVMVLLVPVSMIRSIIEERQVIRAGAVAEVSHSWGPRQQIAGPFLLVPLRPEAAYNLATPVPVPSGAMRRAQDGLASRDRPRYRVLLPTELDYRAQVEPEIRYRGIHEVSVYHARIRISGRFAATVTTDSEIASSLDWSRAKLALYVADPASLTDPAAIVIDGQPHPLERSELPDGTIVADVGDRLGAEENREVEFTLELRLNGTEGLSFAPLADLTTATMASTWPAPSFFGRYLPIEHRVDETGFSASWRVAGFGRTAAPFWTPHGQTSVHYQAAFGAVLYQPVALYQLSMRSVRYAVLVIGLSFVVFFLFEIVAGLRLHPLQYLLVGLANCLFYLLLIAFAEHVGFGLAYFVSSAASILLVGGYSRAILGERLKALSIAGVLAAVYGFLYTALTAESMALLGGSIGLWIVLAVAMYLTRRIDWYSLNKATG